MVSLRRRFALVTVFAFALVSIASAQPSVLPQYSGVTVELGQTATIYMQAYGTAPLSYQWVLVGTTNTNLVNGTTVNGSVISGATAGILAISGTTAADAGNYALKVTDGNGFAVTSTAVALSVKPAAPPVITSQPANVTVVAGNPASFSVNATGSYPRTFQWYKGTPGSGTLITGATSNPFAVNYPLAADAGTYYVVVTNAQGSATSTGATLTVNPATPLTFYYPPNNVTVTVGTSFSLSVSLSGSGPVTYQWYKGGVAITGATNYSYVVNTAATTDAGSYYVTATNAAGTVTSSSATVTVNPPVPPAITQQPQGVSLAYGGYLSLSVSVTGSPPPTYQWYKDNVAIAGATSSYFAISQVTTANAGSYTVVATNAGGTATSSAAVVQVAAAIAPTISTQPASTTVPQGNSTTLSVGAAGSPPLTYAWSKNNQAIAGATSQNYYLNSVQASDAGSYTVVVTNVAGSITSQAAVLTVGPPAPPSFYQYGGSTSQSITAGATLSLSTPSISGGLGPFTYQWYKNGAAITGATNSTYSLPNAQVTDSGSYVVSVTNAGGTASAPPIAVTVAPPANTNTPWIDAKQQGSVAYFLFTNHLERYDLSSSTWLAGVTLTQPATAFCVASDGIYIAFGRALSKYSLDLSSQTALANLAGSIVGVFSHGNYIYAITGSSSSTYPVDRQTGAVGNAYGNIDVSTQSAPSVVVGNAVFVETIWGHSKFSFDSTGALSTNSLTNYYTTFSNAAHIYIYPDQSRVADSSGTAYNVADDSVAGSFAGSFTDLTFLGDGTPVVLRGNVLSKYGGNGGYGETGHLALTATGNSIFASGSTILVFAPGTSTGNNYITATSVAASSLVPAAAAATVDPTGKSYSATAMAQDENGVVYLLNQGVANVFRWSPATQAYLSSIPLAGTPSQIGYSKTRHRLYCVYASGAVTQVDPTAASPAEQPFGNFPLSPNSFLAADNDLFALGGSFSVMVLNGSGQMTAFPDYGYFSNLYSWCSANQSFYGVFSGSINTMPLGSDGTLGTNVSFGYYTSNLSGPVFPSLDGMRVLAASGQIYAGDFSSNLGTLSNSVNDATWLGAAPVTLRAGSLGSEVQLWSASSLKLLSSAELPGAPLRLLPLSGNRLLLVAQVGGAPAFTILNSDLQVISTTAPASGGTGVPSFTLQPAGSVAAFIGTNVDLAVGTAGALPQTFQWYKNNAVIPGATNSVLAFAPLGASDGGNYYVTATNAQGSTNSATVTLGAYPALQFATQPQNQAVAYGTSATLTVTVVGTATVSYQWYVNGSPITGANAATLVTDKVYSVATNGDKYTVSITNAAGTLVSNVALVTIAQVTAPTITGTAYSPTLAVGQPAPFSVTATGTAPLNYQWYFNGAQISGATSSTYNIPSVTTANSGSYSVGVWNSAGSVTSNPMVVTVATPPTITQQPNSYTVGPNTGLNLTVTASSSVPLTYQWYFNGQVIPGATTSVYFISVVTTASVGSYYVVVSNTAGSVTSNTVTVNLSGAVPPPTITSQPASQTVNSGAAVTFGVSCYTPTGTFTFQWYFNGIAIPGATNAIYNIGSASTASAGIYTVDVASVGGTTHSNGATLTVNHLSYAGAYFGSFANGGKWAMYIRSDNTGYYVAYLPQNQGAVVMNVQVAADGSFTATPVTQALANSTAGGPAWQARAATSLSGQIGSSTVTGTLSGAGLTLTGMRDSGSGTMTGYYSTPALNGASGTVYLVVGASGQTMVLSVNGAVADYAVGTLDANSQLAVTSASGSSYSTKIDPKTLLASTIVTPPGTTKPISYAGVSSDGTNTARLINVSVRGMAGTGANVLVGGFAVTGGTKQILVRGVGPTLANYGVTGVLANPAFSVFDANSKLVWSGNAWGGASALAAMFTRVGAFSLPAGSADSATMISTGDNTTIQVGPASGSDGVALAEIYDADAASSTARLVNLSGRSSTGSGSAVLSAGFVIGGSGTETVLLRGVGPTLTTLGVPGAVSATQLTLFDGNSNPMTTNVGWGGDSTLSATFTKVGAFGLAANSADSAMLVTLLPGNYTVQVTGKNGATGVALVEIYEVK